MAQLFDIKKVTVGPRNLVAIVEVAPSAPLYTSDDPQGTELVLGIMPELASHVCLGDTSDSFGEVVAQTELAHLLEHVTVELLARTDAAGDIPCGQTVGVDERTYEITLACPDDVLVAGALSSAVWVLQWAYSGGGEPQPDIDAIVGGLVDLVASLPEPEPPAPAPAPAPAAEPEYLFVPEPVEPVAPAPEPDFGQALDLEPDFEPLPEVAPEAVEPEPVSVANVAQQLTSTVASAAATIANFFPFNFGSESSQDEPEVMDPEDIEAVPDAEPVAAQPQVAPNPDLAPAPQPEPEPEQESQADRTMPAGAPLAADLERTSDLGDVPVVEPAAEFEPVPEPAFEPELAPEPEPAVQEDVEPAAAEPEAEPEAAADEPQPATVQNLWDMDNVPRPRPVR